MVLDLNPWPSESDKSYMLTRCPHRAGQIFDSSYAVIINLKIDVELQVLEKPLKGIEKSFDFCLNYFHFVEHHNDTKRS